MGFLQNYGVQIFGALFGAGGIAAYVFERKKNRAITKGVEADSQSKEISNVAAVADLYKAALDDLENRYQKKYTEIESLYEKKIKMLSDEIKIHKRHNTALRKENLELRRKNAELENQNFENKK